MLTLTVVTPIFQAAAWLEEMLDSVASLRIPHQHVVIDGGSTDGTLEILQARADPEPRVDLGARPRSDTCCE